MDSADYEQKLAKAKESTRKFSKDGGNGLADIAGKFGKLAAAVAGSQAAMAAFNKVMNSSQTYADNYANAINTVKGVVDNVVYSLANADFSSFERGLRKVAEASWAASAAIDQMWNTKQSASYFTAKNRERLVELLNIARDESKTAEQRKQAQAMLDAVIKDQAEVVETTRKDVDAAIYAMINQASGGRLRAEDVDRTAVESALRIDVSLNREELKADIKRQYDIYRKESEKIAKQYGYTETKADMYGRIVSQRRVISEEGQRLLESLDAKYSDIIVKHSTLEVMSDEQLANLISELNYAEQNEKIMGKMVSQAVALNNQLTKSKELAKLTGEQYAQSFGVNYYNTLGNTLAAKAQQGYISIQSEPIISDDIIEESLPQVAQAVQPVIIYEKELQTLQDTALTASEGLGELGNAVANIGGILGDGEDAWFQYVANILSAVSSAIPALKALSAAQAEAAVTKTALSPWTAVSAIAAITAVGAAMANIPRFATGGVVPGNSLSGDNVLIRANSGETVLTKQQANNIGSLLSGGGKVEFEIRGDKLYGVLHNYQKMRGQNYV